MPGKYLGEQLGAPVELFLKPPSSGEPKEGCRQKDKGQPRKRAAQRRQREGQREIFCRQTGKSQQRTLPVRLAAISTKKSRGRRIRDFFPQASLARW